MTDLERAQADNAILRAALDLRTAELLAADKLLRTLSPEAYKLREQRDQLEQIARELVAAIRANVARGTLDLTTEQADQWRDQWLQKIEEAGK